MGRQLAVVRRDRCTRLPAAARVFTLAVLFSIAARCVHAQTPIGTIGLTAGWATFGQAVPQGAAPNGLQVGSLLTQTDVKTRWPDGSIRFAVVTVNALTAGSYAITAAPVASGAFTPALPTASVALTIGTVNYTAALPSTSSTDLWLSGALAYEGRTVIAPVSSADGSAHPFLRVIFDTRVYGDGSGRVDVTVENVLDKTGATTVSYNATITVNGQTAFTKAGVQHYYLTRWRKMFAFGPTAAAAITPDIAPFNAANALPPYLSLIANLVSSPTGVNYDILQAGALDTNMPDHSGRQEIAPYPDWTARYLVYKNQTQRAFVLANGDLSGSWPVHVREAENSLKTGVGPERLVSLDQRPTLWYDARAQGSGYDYVHGTPLPIVEYGSTTPGPGQSPLIPDNAHQPSIAYVPYLLTGDRYYAEEMAFWANYGMIRTYNGDGVRGSQGVLAYNETRGYGWSLRNIVDAAAYYPGSAVRTYLTQKVTSNLTWLDNYANAQSATANPFRILWIGKRPDGNQYIALWEQNYLAYAIDHAYKQGFAGGLAHRDAIAKFQLTLFNSDPAYPKAQGAPFIVGVGVPPSGSLNYTDWSKFTFFTTPAQIWAATQGNERPFAGYYGPEARLNLMIGVEAGWSGAQAAYDYLWPFLGSTNAYCATFGPDKPDLACRAGWALALSSSTPPPPQTRPAQLTSPAAGSTLAGSSQSFAWDAGLGVTSYRLDVGSTQGATNVLAGTATSATSLNVTGLPTDGSTIWVRLSSLISGSWQFVDYSFVTATISSGGGTLAVKSTVFADGTGAVTAGPFSTAAGDLVVAFATASGPAAGGQTLTITGGGLTWTRVARANATPGLADVWRASSPTALSNVSVTSTPSVSTYTQSLTVVTFAGAAGTGASATAGTTGAPSVSLTATAAGSLVYAVANDWDGAIARTLGPNQALTHQWLSTATGDTYWVQNTTTRTASAGSVVQLNDTAPTADRFNIAAVEILTAATGPTTPTITWPPPAPIVYGTKLSATQLNATASVPGSFVYSPAVGTLPGAGTQTLSVTFTPTDTVAYQTATASVSLTVNKATPAVTWSAPAGIVYGTALSATQLNATTTMPGSFVYTPASGTVLSTGAGQTLSVTFTPTDTANYNSATKTVAITVTKATPAITWAAPAGIVYGTALGATQLNATANVAGSFVYTPASGTVLTAGAGQTLSTTFTPTDTTNYNSATQTVTITVSAAPSVALSSTTAGAGGVVSATVANGPALPGDFVGLYDAGGTAVVWNYLNGTQTMPATGVANAVVLLALPVTAGTYQARFYNASYTLLATSASLTTTQPTVALNATTGRAGGTVTATIANGPGLPGDFVGLYDASGNAMSWMYMNGTQVKPAAGIPNASLTMTLPPTAGTYEARLYNASYVRMATSASIAVTVQATVALSAATANAGGIVAATAANGPGSPGDFVGLYDGGGANVGWWYLNGTHAMPATGMSGGTVSFTLPAAAGTYQARYYDATYALLATSGSVVVTMPSVTLGAATGAAGGSVAATVANAPGTAGDWAGLYDAAGNAVTWQYLNGTRTMPAAGVSSAVLTFILPPAAGTYHVRLFNGSYMRVATSGTITTTSPTVTLGSSSANAGGRITATIVNGPGMPGDWAGLYDAGGNAVQWQYLNGAQTKPATGFTSAVLTFNLPPAPGTFQVRLFNASYILVATSAAVTTTAPSVTLNAAAGNAGGTVTATIANAPGTPGDWVGLYDSGGNAVGWKYLNGTQTMPASGVTSATITFMLPPTAVTFYVRLCNGSYVQVATSATITTTVATLTPSATSVSVGAAVAVVIANAPGTPGDWAGLYDAGGNAVQWQYLNGTQTMPASGVTSATLTFTMPSTPGTYQIRLFNGSYTPIAVSAPLSAN